MSLGSEVISVLKSIDALSLDTQSANYVWFGLCLESPVSEDLNFGLDFMEVVD